MLNIRDRRLVHWTFVTFLGSAGLGCEGVEEQSSTKKRPGLEIGVCSSVSNAT